MTGAFILAALALFAGWRVYAAEAHYKRGLEAADAGRFAAAIQEFNAASILGVTYRDAAERASAAAAALNADLRREYVLQTRLEKGVLRDVRAAYARLAKGDAAGTEQALASARARVPTGPLSEDPLVTLLLSSLSRRIGAAGRAALSAGRWGAASDWAAALLHIDAGDAAAARLAARARRGARLQERLDDARAAARRGQWRQALRLARSVLDEWPGFPGAAALAREARAALAPAPSPSPAPAPTATPAPTPPSSPKPTPPPP